MLEKHITFVADCDLCGVTSLDTDEHEFMSAVAAMKREGWKNVKDKNGNWDHVCPACQEDSITDGFTNEGED